ncbi:MAG: hypothetical protein ACC661_11110, partial [Verrucomicrobiales bacterium]
MRSPCQSTVALLGLALSVFAARPAAAAGDAVAGRSVSSSGAFVIYGAEARARGALGMLAEEVREGFHRVLQIEGREKFRIVIQIHTELPSSRPERFVRGQVRPVQTGYRFQLDVLLAEGFERESFTTQLVRLLMLEEMLRDVEGGDGGAGEGLILPPWLHYGVAELVRYAAEGTPNKIYAGLLRSGHVLLLDEILEGEPTGLNSVAHTVFRASAAALVRSLAQRPSGGQRVVVFMRALPGAERSQKELLWKFFPSLGGDEKSLEKWWALELLVLGQPGAVDFLDPVQTQELLQQALTVRLKSNEDESAQLVRLRDFERIVKLKERERLAVLAPSGERLLKLSVSSFPLYRGIVAEYSALLERVAEGKKRGLRKRFVEVEDAAYRLGQDLRDARDYMNWFEATQLGEKSGAFEDYKRAVQRMRRRGHRRTDRIS